MSDMAWWHVYARVTNAGHWRALTVGYQPSPSPTRLTMNDTLRLVASLPFAPDDELMARIETAVRSEGTER